jgi:hypothetical protein
MLLSVSLLYSQSVQSVDITGSHLPSKYFPLRSSAPLPTTLFIPFPQWQPIFVTTQTFQPIVVTPATPPPLISPIAH